jgi:hypothetical protein
MNSHEKLNQSNSKLTEKNSTSEFWRQNEHQTASGHQPQANNMHSKSARIAPYHTHIIHIAHLTPRHTNHQHTRIKQQQQQGHQQLCTGA